MMSVVPIGSSGALGIKAGLGSPNDALGVQARYPGVAFSQFEGAEIVCKKYNLTREYLEGLAVASHARAVQANKEGRFKKEIIPVIGVDPKTGKEVLHEQDEGIRPDTSMEGLAKLPTLAPGGIITGNSPLSPSCNTPNSHFLPFQPVSLPKSATVPPPS